MVGLGVASRPWAWVRRVEEVSRPGDGPALLSRKDLPVLELKGQARERGRIHGESLKKEIREMVGLSRSIAREASFIPEEYERQIVGKTGLLAAAERWTPALVEEIRGIGEGAGLEFTTIFAWNLLDESDWFINQTRWENRAALPKSACSAFGVFKEGGRPSLIAQNADMGPDFDGYQTMLRIVHGDSDLEELVLTCPGCIGIWGLNNKSVGVCLNALTSQLQQSPDGLGTLFVARGILSHSRLEDAVKFVQGVKHASGEAYTIGGPDEVVCLEASANAVRRFIPFPGATRVYHTNHPLVSDDIWLEGKDFETVAPPFKQPFREHRLNSEARLEALKKRLSDPSKPVTVETAKSILRSHDDPEYPVCRHGRPGQGDITTFSLIMDLKPSPEFHVAPGPPCKTEFRTYTF
jgi:hypothetical protein